MYILGLLHTQEVRGSSPLPPTIASVLSEQKSCKVTGSALEELPLRELLESLLGVEGRRRLMLRHKTNEELFRLYDSELVLRNHNERQLKTERRLLRKFLL